MSTMEDTHSNNMSKGQWSKQSADTAFLQNEVKGKLKVKESKPKTSQKPVSSGYMLEYEEQSRAYKKKAKELKKKKAERAGAKYESSSSDEEASQQSSKNGKTGGLFRGNFSKAPISKTTKQKHKRMAKKKKEISKSKKKRAAQRYSESEEDEDEDGDDGDSRRRKRDARKSSSSSSDSLEDNTPSVRYGKQMKSQRGGSKFQGIRAMSQKKKKEKENAKPATKNTVRKKQTAKKRKQTTSSEEEEETESASNDTPSPSPPAQVRRRKQQKKQQTERTAAKKSNKKTNANESRRREEEEEEEKQMEEVAYKEEEKEKERQKEEEVQVPDEEEEVIGVELSFDHIVEREFCEMLQKPEGVMCGGETLMYYQDKRGKEYFYLATDDEEDVVGVLEYDVVAQTWRKFADYPEDFAPDLHGNCINIKAKKLYIFDRKQFAILDLNTKEWRIESQERKRVDSDTVSKVGAVEYDPVGSDTIYKIKPNMSPNLRSAMSAEAASLECLGIQSVYMPAPIDEIHIFARTKIPPGSYHLLLDEMNKYIKLDGFDRDELMRGHKLVYCEGAGKLIVCGGQRQDDMDGNWMDSTNIYMCDVKRAHQMKGYNWRLLPVKLPYGGKTFGAVCAYGSILVVIYLRDNEKKEIYCLDLMQREQDYRFVKSTKTFPFEGDCEYTDMITTHDDMVHCMYFSVYGHCRLSLKHIIPNELQNRYRLRFANAVYGFIGQSIDRKMIRRTPESVVKGICKYLCELC